MDDTHARAAVDEEKAPDASKALDSSRLRSSARLGIINAAAAAAAASSFSSSSAANAANASTSAVVRRKRKKRRRHPREDCLRKSPPCAATSTSALREPASSSTSSSRQVPAEASLPTSSTSASADDNAGTVDPLATLAVLGSAPTAATTPADSSASAPEVRPKASARIATTTLAQERVGSSSSAAAGAVLGRRAGKRSARRCNSAAQGGRRNAMTMDLQRLISEVHARPAIWDQKNVNYHNRDVILKMWREIARACEVSTDVAKSKWKHLRDNFRNELKKTYRGKCDGVLMGGSEHDSKWVWFKSLFFLREQMNSRVIGCAMSQNCAVALRSLPDGTQIEPQIDILEGHGEAQFDDLDGDSCQSLLSNEDNALHEVMPPPKMNKIGRKRTLVDSMDDYQDMDGRKRYECVQKRLALGQDDEDDTYHFLMSVRNPLRSLPLDRQMFVRLKIQELVYNEINSQSQQGRPYDVGSPDVKPIRTGNGNGAAAAGEAASDMSNPASLLQNCTPEGSSDDAFFG